MSRNVAVAHLSHARAHAARAAREHRLMRCERGQATIEWTGLVLLASLALGALAIAVPLVDGRSFGGFLAHHIVCAIRGTACDDGDSALARTYGSSDAALLRRFAPDLVYEPGERQLPVDYRRCRSPACASAPDDPDLDSHRTTAGLPATAFTHIVRRGGRVYLQYWFYYPDSNSRFAGSDRAWALLPDRLRIGRLSVETPDYPGYHRDDWEGHQIRLDGPDDTDPEVRSSSHGHYQWCKQAECRDEWGPRTGWTRVSSGSHAGHIPLERQLAPGAGRARMRRGGRGSVRVGYSAQLSGRDLRERTTTGGGLRLVPLESVDRRGYRPLDPGIKPPWLKRVYRDPESDES